MRSAIADHFLLKAIKHSNASLSRISLAAGQFAFHQGDEVHGVYIVQSGRILLNRCQSDGSVVTLFCATTGESFAEAALSSDHYHCDAVAALDSIVVVLPVDQLRHYFLADAASAMELAMFFSRQVRDLRARLELRNVRSATDRTFQWLKAHASGTPSRLELPCTWSELSDELGLTREALYRTLAKLEQAGLIERDKRVVVLNTLGCKP